MTGFATGLRLMHPDNHNEARLYYENKEGHQMHKRLKISAELHAEIKKEAKDKGMFIDEFLRLLMDQHKIVNELNKRK